MYNTLFEKGIDIQLTPDQDLTQAHTFGEFLDSPDTLILSDRGKGQDDTTRHKFPNRPSVDLVCTVVVTWSVLKFTVFHLKHCCDTCVSVCLR